MPTIVALCLAMLLSACSAVRLGYAQAPTLAYWWLDRYIDFNDAQTPRVRDALTDWFAWHRRTQLIDYATLLARAQNEVVADTTPAQACAWWSEARLRLDTAMEQMLPAATDLALTLTPKQIDHIEARYAKLNDEFRDEQLKASAAKRQEKLVERAVERAENIYGRLDDAQRALVVQAMAASPFDTEVWFADHQRRQRETLQMLRTLAAEAPSREQAQPMLKAFFDRLYNTPPDTYRRYADRVTEFNCDFAATLHNTTSTAQRQTAARKLKGWEVDLRALAADAMR